MARISVYQQQTLLQAFYDELSTLQAGLGEVPILSGTVLGVRDEFETVIRVVSAGVYEVQKVFEAPAYVYTDTLILSQEVEPGAAAEASSFTVMADRKVTPTIYGQAMLNVIEKFELRDGALTYNDKADDAENAGAVLTGEPEPNDFLESLKSGQFVVLTPMRSVLEDWRKTREQTKGSLDKIRERIKRVASHRG